LLKYVQTCKNIIECSNFVYIIPRPSLALLALDLAFIDLDSINSLHNPIFANESRVRTSSIGNDEPGHYRSTYVDKSVGKILWHRFEAKANIK